MKNLGKLATTAAAVLVAAKIAMPFSMQDFYEAMTAKFSNAVQTDSLDTKQYEYKRDGSYVEMNDCVMIDNNGTNDLVVQRAYFSFADDSTAVEQDSATYEKAIMFEKIDTSANLDTTVSDLEKQLTGNEDVTNIKTRNGLNYAAQQRKVNGSYDLKGRKISPKNLPAGNYINKNKRINVMR